MYSPEIEVIHAYDKRGRPNWRRYYFDTRNHLWFALRNLSFWYGIKYLVIGWGAMLVFSVRDGFFMYWLKGVFDSLRWAKRAWKDRCPPSKSAKMRWRVIEGNKPGFFKMVHMRLARKGVKV